jgi:uncharacterized protein
MQPANAYALPDTLPNSRRDDAPSRLHLNHGPIDLIIGVWGAPDDRLKAHDAARTRFATILDELVSELTALRSAYNPDHNFQTPVARRMAQAVRSFSRDSFITPMAAVAGAVADEVLSQILEAADLPRAFVNNGGDVAVHVSAGEQLTIGIVSRPDAPVPAIDRHAVIDANSGISGIATSGRHGRSFSLGIADAVTILGANAAIADAAATMIANQVDIDSPAIGRIPAHDLDPDSDLGSRLVVTDVGDLTDQQTAYALDQGMDKAEDLCRTRTILGAHLQLGQASRSTGHSARHLAHPSPVLETINAD